MKKENKEMRIRDERLGLVTNFCSVSNQNNTESDMQNSPVHEVSLHRICYLSTVARAAVKQSIKLKSPVFCNPSHRGTCKSEQQTNACSQILCKTIYTAKSNRFGEEL